MNRHAEKECQTSVPILYRITVQNPPYMDFSLLMLTSFEVTMNSQELLLNKAGANMQLPYKAHFGGAIFRQRIGPTNVWQFDAPSRSSQAPNLRFVVIQGYGLCQVKVSSKDYFACKIKFIS